MRRNRPLSRARKTQPERRRFLIYCEDACAGKQYLSGLRTQLRRHPVQVCIGPWHGEPLNLVKEAVAHMKRAPKTAEDRFTEYDEVWCVMDVEAPQAHAGIEGALHMARRAGVRVALSNPCFELWLLLHFTDVAGFRTTKQAQQQLEQYRACGYSSSRKHLVYEPLQSRYAEARKRARALREAVGDWGQGTSSTLPRNPYADVDVLVEELSSR